jgi:general secretion pathway protein J
VRTRVRGFTLIELMVALFIAALMFAMGYGAIGQGFRNHDTLKEQQAHLVELQTAMRVMEQDFVQLTPRPVRQPVGDDPAQPALQASGQGTSGITSTLGTSSSTLGSSSSAPGSPGSAGTSGTAQTPIVALTRSGWANPAGLQRPGLQRVAYYVDNGTLKREYWNVLDPTLASTTATRDLLTHVKSLSFRFLDVNRTWQTQWPPQTVAGPIAAETSLRLRPIAVEITLDTEDWGKIVRVLEIPG